MQQHGHIFDIQRMSVHDGPGIRTVVFLKGCPLHCLWCHNPEGINFASDVFYNRTFCTLCGACVRTCEHGSVSIFSGITRNFCRETCQHCGRCVETCPSGALEIIGRSVSVQEVMDEVLRDIVFYEESGGGMTLSGGEPLLQYDFSRQLLQSAREHDLHTCIETCGYGNQEHLLSLASLADSILFDWKESDPKRHREWTGVDNASIRENLIALDKQGTEIILRCPIIPTLNQRPDHLTGIAALASALNHCREVHLMAYHAYGQSKYERLGQPLPLADVSPVTSEGMQETLAMFAPMWRGKIRVY